MKKKLVCLLASLVVACACMAPAMALERSWFKEWESDFNTRMQRNYWLATNWLIDYQNEVWMSAVFVGDSIENVECDVSQLDGRDMITLSVSKSLVQFYLDDGSMRDSGRQAAWNFTCPVYERNYPYRLIGYLWPNPDGVSGNFFHTMPYTGPSYDLENDWLSQTTGEGAYIIAPKNGKVFNGKDGTTQIVAQYRFENREVLWGAGWYTTMQFIGYNKTLSVELTGDIFKGIFKLGDSQTSIVSHEEKVVTDANGKEWLEGTIVVQGNTPRNCEVEVQLRAHYTGPQPVHHLMYESNKVTFSWFEDIVDEDGDGVDDRDEDPGYQPDLPPASGGDLSGFNDIGGMLTALKGTLTGFLGFLTEFFKYIPQQIFILLGVGVALVILLRVFGR